MRTAIYGAGSLGTVLGAYLSKAGVRVDLINRNRAHVEALNKNGAHISGTVDFTVPVKAILPEEMNEQYDLIILLTKQLDNVNVVKSIAPFLADDGVICTMQNGLPEISVASVIGEDRVLGCSVVWGATLLGPGEAELTSEPDSMNFGLGRMNGKKDDKLRAVASVLENMCPVELDDNFMGVRWSKLLINSAFSGMSAVLGCTFGEVAQNKSSKRAALHIMKEVIDVAKASGVTIEPVQGKDIVSLFYFTNPIKEKIALAILPAAIKKHKGLKASMLQDLEKGKKCEIDAINGVVCECGRNFKISTPFNDKVCEIVHGIENGKYKYEMSNARLFDSI